MEKHIRAHNAHGLQLVLKDIFVGSTLVKQAWRAVERILAVMKASVDGRHQECLKASGWKTGRGLVDMGPNKMELEGGVHEEDA